MKKIASKLAKRLKKVSNQKVVQLSAYKEQKQVVNDLIKEITINPADDIELNPLHSVYSQGQRLLSVLIELLQDFPELNKHYSIIEKSDEMYVPQGPPMSPLTKSFFNCWVLFDLSVGINKETLTGIIIELGAQLKLDKNFLYLFEKLNQSRMGIYEFIDTQGDKVILKELQTNQQLLCFNPTGYQGSVKGELWYARILPPVFNQFDYSVIFTTPYVLITSSIQDWNEYFNRTISTKKSKTTTTSYEHLMKYGLFENYWNEYVMQAYVNHREDFIYLQGLPDISSTRPHYSDDNQFSLILPEANI